MGKDGHNPLVLLFGTIRSSSNSKSSEGVFVYARCAGWHLKTVKMPSLAEEDKASVDAEDIRCLKSVLDFWKPDGCIVMGDAPVATKDPSWFGEVPVVYLDGQPEQLGKEAYCVSCDNSMVAHAAAKELLSLGFESYAYVSYFRRLNWCEQRREVFKGIVRDNGNSFSSFRLPRQLAQKPQQRRFSQWLSSLPKPCGIFAANDIVADAVIGQCFAQKFSVPGDVAVIGVDDDETICENSLVSISSIAPDFHSAGLMAASMLDGLMTEGKSVPLNGVFPAAEVVRRKSTRVMKRYDVRVNNALEYIRRNAFRGISVSDVVQQMGCSRRNADLLFSRLIGRSILDEIQDVRIGLVKKSLFEADRNLKVVAANCGYGSASDMRRAFKRHEGMSLSEYVRMISAQRFSLNKGKV